MARRIGNPTLQRYYDLWADEIAGVDLYRQLADVSEGERREIFLGLARSEERHVQHWRRMLERNGVTDLEPPRRPLRNRVLTRLARRFGSDSVLPIVLRQEASNAERYRRFAAATTVMADQEALHSKTLAAMTGEGEGSQIRSSEGRHRGGAGGWLRAAVFGFNDGLLSNLGLVTGAAGGTDRGRFVMLVGLVGLLAGAFSMASGEWLSVTSQRELYERELAIEREELEHMPDEEAQELELIYRAKGVPQGQARALVGRIMEDPEMALETLAREELGIEPANLGAPWLAAGSSIAAFSFGALIPLLPFLIGSGTVALAVSFGLSAVALFGVGVVTSVFTARGPVRTGLRQVAIGAVIAALTFGLGKLVGTTVS
jgi:VIT1/CCC1 family predicted Fe2+/Mn2+ transporter